MKSKTCIVTAALMLLIFKVILNIILVPSGSMEPTIKKNSIGLAVHAPFIFKKNISPDIVRRGDAVVFYSEEEGKTLCKRVIGIGGDHIRIQEGRVYLNGGILVEEYLKEPDSTYSIHTDFYVPEGCMFLMGDNRYHSNDSRKWAEPFISIEQVQAKWIFTNRIPG